MNWFEVGKATPNTKKNEIAFLGYKKYNAPVIQEIALSSKKVIISKDILKMIFIFQLNIPNHTSY